MSDIDILRDAIETLGSVKIPVELFESVGVPVYHVRQNLTALLRAAEAVVNKAKEEKESKQVEEENKEE